jgi:uncharacterized protein YyaL (SSP411 family)
MCSEADGAYAAELFAVTRGGHLRARHIGPQLLVDPADLEHYERIRSALLPARSDRVWPGRDDTEIVAAWNGLTIAALAESWAAFLDRPGYVDAASAAAELLSRVHLDSGRLAGTS